MSASPGRVMIVAVIPSKMLRFAYFFLSLALSISTLSAISFISSPTGHALSNSDCTPTVSGLTATGLASGNNCVITFTAGNGTWTKPVGVTSVRYLIVGGGGAGGSALLGSAGGGGGGQVRSATLSITSNTSFAVVVGAGGTPTDVATVASGGNGVASSITPNGGTLLSAAGGGGGANSRIHNANPQGSGSTSGWTGGGGSSHEATTVAGSTGTGGASAKGGNGFGNANTNLQAAGGGGGAGGVGAAATSGVAGAGGVGISSDISGSSSNYGAGGGGAKRTDATGTAASGGNGGGGTGAIGATSSTSGTAGTGGGGGGGGEYSASKAGGSGGNGVVVFLYDARPVITSLNVTSGVTAGGASVTITGLRLSTTTGVTVDGVAGTNLVVTSDTSVAFTTPAGSTGAKDVIVTTAYGDTTGVGGFTYYTTLTPACGTSGTFTIANNIVTNSASCVGTVSIPEGVKSIADYAFCNLNLSCVVRSSNITSLSIPSTVSTIGSYAFIRAGVTSLSIASPSQLTSIGVFAFSYAGLTSVTIPSSLTSIGGGAFYAAGNLATVSFQSPSSLTSIGAVAGGNQNGIFSGTKITSLVLPSSITSIGFKMEAPLTRLTINGNLTSFANNSLPNSLVCLVNPNNNAYINNYTYPSPPPKIVTDANQCGTQPTITSLSPSSGTNAGGATVTLTGTGLSGVNKVWVAGALATNVSVLSSTSLTFTTPVTATFGPVAAWVSGTDGPGSRNNSFSFISSNANLSLLAISGTTLSPAFASATTSYTASVANGVSAITVTPTRAQGSATIKVNGTTVASGTASTSIPLNVGSNVITVVVTAQDATATKSYTITITRAAGDATYSVILAAGTNGTGSNRTLTKTNGTNLALPDSPTANSYFARTGYTVTAWSSSDLGSQAYALSGSYSIESATTLYPVWTANTLTVTYDSKGGGSVASSSTTTDGSISAAPTAPSRGGYTFAGWSATDGGSAVNFPLVHGKTANFALYALWTGNTYVLTYDYNSATSDSSTVTSSFTTGGTVITLPTPLRIGFSLDGWYADTLFATSIGGGGAHYSPSGSSLTPSAFAKWSAISRTVTYSAATATGGVVPTDSTNYFLGDKVVVKGNTGSLVRSGYTFLGWTYASNGTGTVLTSGMTYTTATENMVFYAKWSANTYTVTYNSNNGDGIAQRSSANVTSDSYTSGGSEIAVPGGGTLSRSGYTFGGWNLSAAGNLTNYLEAASFTTAIDIILYAKWTPEVYAITYNGNTSDGGSAPTTGGYTTGQALPYSVLANSFTKTSNVFGGWNTESDGTGTSYSPGANITTLAAITLYATWIPQYTLHYAINGGTVTSGSLPADQPYSATTSVGPVFSSLSRNGYTFAGWTNGSTTILPGGSFTIVGDSVLTAKWNAIDYKINYDSNGGSTTPGQITKQIGQNYTVADGITKTGYTFTGWLNGSTKVGAGAVITTGNIDVTYVAQWTANVYTITYDWNGGSGSTTSNETFTVGGNPVSLPSVGDHVKDGYTFGGWAASLNGPQVSDSYTATSDVNLYARWGTGSYTITYNANGGTVTTSSASILSGSTLILPTPNRESFVFEGWYTSTSGGDLIGLDQATYLPTQSRNAYALWTQASLHGISPSSLTRIGSITASSSSSTSFSHVNSLSSVSISVPAGALPNGTVVNFDLVGDYTRAQSVLAASKTYIISLIVSWLTTSGTVPDTASDKPISMTVANDTIKTGSSVYAIISGVSTLLGTATQDGTVTVSITSDPEVVIVTSKPSPPTSVAATSNGAALSEVSWTAPSDGGSAISRYNVTSSGGQTCTTSTTSCTVDTLSTGTSYTFTVTATNINGTSLPSAAATARTAGKPGAPTSVIASEGAIKESLLSWVAPSADGGSSITGYTATANGGAFCSTASTSCTVTGLSDATTYTFTVTATNALGTSDASATATASTAGKPSAPTSITASAGGTRQSLISWAVPSFDGGSPITGYTASSSGGTSCTTASTNCTITGLSDGTTYTFTVIASNALGSSDASASISARTGGTSSELPSQQLTSLEPDTSNLTILQPVTVVGVTQTKIPTIEITTSLDGIDSKPTTVKVDTASARFIAEAKVVEGRLVLTPESGFSGKRTVTVTITENGVERFIQIPLTVLPETVSKPVVTPTSSSKSVIRWALSPNAGSYTIYIDGKLIARGVTTTSYTINRILGPNSVIEIVSNGGDRTISEKIVAGYNSTVSVLITRLVSSTRIMTSLTKNDTKALDKVIALIKNQGFRAVVISNITTTKKTSSVAAARINAIKKYLGSKAEPINVTYEVTIPTSRNFFNNISVKA